jgi:polyphosphate kinase
MTETVAPPADADVRRAEALPEDRFLNREASWLDFNTRVLELAEDRRTPLLERVKFAAIFASNLDEFFMVRVAGLKRRLATGLTVRSPDGLTTREQLGLIGERAGVLQRRHATAFAEQIVPDLAKAGITITTWVELPDKEKHRLHTYFREQVFPVLTPLAVDPAHPFPYISGLSLNLAVVVRDAASAVEHFARVKVPAILPRFVRIQDEATDDPADGGDAHARFLPLEELIGAHLGQLFPGMQIVERHLFRVTRNADVEIEEDETEDLLQALEKELARRRFGPAVRLEVGEDMSERSLDLLTRELEVHPRDVLAVPGLLDLTALWALADLDRPELKDEPYVRSLHPRLAAEDGTATNDIFGVLRDGDVLVHHPYDSFATSVQRFIEQAAADPNVLAIKQTLYRTSGDSPLVEALIDAAEAGKQVVVLVEIKARFDEQNNITWARALERAGCHVVYGVVGLKTHCKAALVVRHEKGQLRRYAHIGTGNYNPKTARIYEDFGLLTADPAVGSDLTELFNTLTGYSRASDYRTLLVAPQQLRNGLVERIEGQALRARIGKPARIRIKANSLVDEDVVDALYEAARAGVEIDCVIRGICVIRPGVPGLSETVRVRSVLGRYLEHSRIYSFGVGPEAEWWLGSADIMHRNLDRRVEVLVRVADPTVVGELNDTFERALDPDTAAWDLDDEGTWIRRGSLDMQAEIAHAMAQRGG